MDGPVTLRGQVSMVMFFQNGRPRYHGRPVNHDTRNLGRPGKYEMPD